MVAVMSNSVLHCEQRLIRDPGLCPGSGAWRSKWPLRGFQARAGQELGASLRSFHHGFHGFHGWSTERATPHPFHPHNPWFLLTAMVVSNRVEFSQTQSNRVRLNQAESGSVKNQSSWLKCRQVNGLAPHPNPLPRWRGSHCRQPIQLSQTESGSNTVSRIESNLVRAFQVCRASGLWKASYSIWFMSQSPRVSEEPQPSAAAPASYSVSPPAAVRFESTRPRRRASFQRSAPPFPE